MSDESINLARQLAARLAAMDGQLSDDASMDKDYVNETPVDTHIDALLALGSPEDLLQNFVDQLVRLLPRLADGGRVLVDLVRFLEGSRSPQSWLALFEREPDALATLVQLFAISQYLADWLIADPESFDLLRMTQGQPVDRQVLQDEILAEVAAAADARSVMRVLRDYRHRETLRIAYGDFIAGQSTEIVTAQISELCESILAAALVAAKREMAQRGEVPVGLDGRPLECVVLALGKLGGSELNYSSDIDLVLVHESPPADYLLPRSVGGGPRSNKSTEQAASEYFQRLGQTLIRLLSETTSRGIAYRVDMRLRPHGQQGPLVVSYDAALEYYDSYGRTWERQAFIKARSVAGDLQLGNQLLDQLQSWVYRRYLMRADIAGIAALKRRIERHSRESGDDVRNVKLGHGGIRDIEYVVQFLQLLHGGEEPSVRSANTMDGLRRLAAAGCLTAEEQSLLEDNYSYLRQLEHFLQIMYDRQTHALPADPQQLRSFVARLQFGHDEDALDGLVNEFENDLQRRTQQNRKVLEHLLHDAFARGSMDQSTLALELQAHAESDLILDPEPDSATVARVLEPYGFSDPQAAYRHLQELSVESIPFLSTRRCRHFLSAIAPQLLQALAQTPSPDGALINLANVSESIGGKAVLWELFSSNPATMDLCLRICAGSPYLTGILTGNPGMIDELLDSLMLDTLPTQEEMSTQLGELCRGADDLAPILHSFKNSMHLRVGVRNLLGKDPIAVTHAALANIAEVCLEQVIMHEFHRLVRTLGIPMRREAVEAAAKTANEKQPKGSQVVVPPQSVSGDSAAAELVVLAIGKLGAREPNYHSDIDLIFVFDGEGSTQSLLPDRRFRSTTNRHFFNQLCQRVIHSVTRVGTAGRLYDVDVRLRPSGRSGELAITIDDLSKYFNGGGGQLWERQALCKARPIWGSPAAQAAAMECVHDVLRGAMTAALQQAEQRDADAESNSQANADAESQVDSQPKPQADEERPSESIDTLAPDAARRAAAAIAEEVWQQRLNLQVDASERNIKRGIGGTMDVEFTVQLLQLVHACDAPQCLVPGTLAAAGELHRMGAISDTTAKELSENYGLLRRVESGIRLMDLMTRHDLPQSDAELDKLAYVLARGSSGDLSRDSLVAESERVRSSCRAILEATWQSFCSPQASESPSDS